MIWPCGFSCGYPPNLMNTPAPTYCGASWPSRATIFTRSSNISPWLAPCARSAGTQRRGREQDQGLVECFRSDGGACNLLPRCRLRTMLAAAKEAFYEHLDRYTLADCLAGTAASIAQQSG